MTEPVFVDTNVFVYARDAGERVKQAGRGAMDSSAVDRAERPHETDFSPPAAGPS